MLTYPAKRPHQAPAVWALQEGNVSHLFVHFVHFPISLEPNTTQLDVAPNVSTIEQLVTTWTGCIHILLVGFPLPLIFARIGWRDHVPFRRRTRPRVSSVQACAVASPCYLTYLCTSTRQPTITQFPAFQTTDIPANLQLGRLLLALISPYLVFHPLGFSSLWRSYVKRPMT